jgi:CO/xanthine dehydrogenase Mo-binding subunit
MNGITERMDRDEPAGAAMDRREFLRRVGGGVVVLFTTAPRLGFGDTSAEAPSVPAFNAYLRIGEDGRVTCFTGKIEMGQDVITSLPQMLADELDVAVDMIDMVMGDTDRCPFDQGTWGSLTTRAFGPELRTAGAQARRALLELASERLGAPLDRLQVEQGVVFDAADTKRRVAYAELTRGRAILRAVDGEAPTKPAADYRAMGTPLTRRDARDKVTGAAQYAADIRLPGMLHARMLRPSSHGASLKKLDTSAVVGIEGAQVVQDGDLVAVLHPQRDMADRASARLQDDFDVTEPAVDERTI